MGTSAASLRSGLAQDDLRGVLRLAIGAFALFVAGAGATMTAAGLFDPLLLTAAAAVNLVAMLLICALTATALDLAAPRSDGQPGWRMRVARRTLQLASIFWAAAGLAFLLSPALARL